MEPGYQRKRERREAGGGWCSWMELTQSERIHLTANNILQGRLVWACGRSDAPTKVKKVGK